MVEPVEPMEPAGGATGDDVVVTVVRAEVVLEATGGLEGVDEVGWLPDVRGAEVTGAADCNSHTVRSSTPMIAAPAVRDV